MLKPPQYTRWSLTCLDNDYTISIRYLKKEDFRDKPFNKKPKEQLVAEKLMGKKGRILGQIGVFEDKAYIYTTRGWIAVKRNKKGKHVLER